MLPPVLDGGVRGGVGGVRAVCPVGLWTLMANVANIQPIHSPTCKVRIEGIYKRLRRERMVLCERESNSDLVKCRSCMIHSVAPTANYS